MSCFKRFAVVVGAVAMMASSSFAAWDMFPVLEAGKVQAKIFSSGTINLRFSPMENLEIFSTNSINYLYGADYAVGARYQLVPEMLSAFLDVGIPGPSSGVPADNSGLGLVPGVQFSMNFTEQFSLGLLAAFGIDTDWYKEGGVDDRKGQIMGHLGVELELGYSFSENFGAFLGTGFEYDRMTQENREDLEIKDALGPYFGVWYSVDALTVSTSLGLNLNERNKKGEESMAVSGGVDLTITF
jgi:opacity protein-like surface antigen